MNRREFLYTGGYALGLLACPIGFIDLIRAETPNPWTLDVFYFVRDYEAAVGRVSMINWSSANWSSAPLHLLKEGLPQDTRHVRYVFKQKPKEFHVLAKSPGTSKDKLKEISKLYEHALTDPEGACIIHEDCAILSTYYGLKVWIDPPDNVDLTQNKNWDRVARQSIIDKVLLT